MSKKSYIVFIIRIANYAGPTGSIETTITEIMPDRPQAKFKQQLRKCTKSKSRKKNHVYPTLSKS